MGERMEFIAGAVARLSVHRERLDDGDETRWEMLLGSLSLNSRQLVGAQLVQLITRNGLSPTLR